DSFSPPPYRLRPPPLTNLLKLFRKLIKIGPSCRGEPFERAFTQLVPRPPGDIGQQKLPRRRRVQWSPLPHILPRYPDHPLAGALRNRHRITTIKDRNVGSFLRCLS